MNLIDVFSKIAMLFIIIMIGFLARKRKWLNENSTSDIITLILNVTVPALIITSMLEKKFDSALISETVQVLFIALVSYPAFAFLSIILVRFMRPQLSDRGIYRFMLIFTNVSFIGFPMVETVFGVDGLFYAVLYTIIYNIMVFSLGIFILTSDKKDQGCFKWNMFLTPTIFSVIIGFILMIFNIELPLLAINTLSMLGHVTTPLSLIVVGSLLSTNNFSTLFGNWRVYMASLLRLVVLPLIYYFILSVLPLDDLVRNVCTLTVAMPCATMQVILSERYKCNAALASQGVFISTLFSLISLPFIVYVIL